MSFFRLKSGTIDGAAAGSCRPDESRITVLYAPPGESHVLVGSEDGRVTAVGTKTFAVTANLATHADAPEGEGCAVVFVCQHAGQVCSYGEDGMFRVWTVARGGEEVSRQCKTNSTLALCSSSFDGCCFWI